MKNAQDHSLQGYRAQGWLALGVLSAAIMVTFILLAGQDLRARMDAALRQGHDTTWFITRAVTERFRFYDRALLDLAATADELGADAFDSPHMWDCMVRTASAAPHARSVGLYDSEGRVRQHSDRLGGFPGISVADREYFKTLKSGVNPGAYVATPFRSRVYNETIFAMTRAIHTSKGEFSGAILIALAPDTFDLLGAIPSLPQDTVITVYRRDGVVLFSSSGHPDQVGADYSAAPLFTQALAQAPSGELTSANENDIFDADSRLLTYRSIDEWPLVVVVGIPRAQILANWRAAWLRNGVLVGLALIGFSWLTIIVQRQINGRLTAELSLKSQELQYHCRIEEELRHWATIDSLTGIANRRHFLELAEREWQRSRRYDRPLAVLIFDVDFFKSVNDTFGHATGDEALRRIAAVAQNVLRETDALGRLGGEEFGVLLPETDPEGALELAERLRSAISDIRLEAEGRTVPLSVSIGCAISCVEDPSLDTSFCRADQGLYRAKDSGRNRVEVVGAVREPTFSPADSYQSSTL